MKRLIIILLISVLLSSCASMEFVKWEDLSKKEKTISVVCVVGGLAYSTFMVYWIMNPSDSDNWGPWMDDGE